MTPPRAFYLTLPNGNPKLLTVNTLGELQDIVLAHYPITTGAFVQIVNVWTRVPVVTGYTAILREVQA